MSTPLDRETLAKRLQQARVNAGITQDEAAKALGVPRTAIVQMESGNRSVSTLELAQLATLYRVPVTYFFAAEELEEEDAMVALMRCSDEFQLDRQAEDEIHKYLRICQFGVQLKELLGLLYWFSVNRTIEGPS